MRQLSRQKRKPTPQAPKQLLSESSLPMYTLPLAMHLHVCVLGLQEIQYFSSEAQTNLSMCKRIMPPTKLELKKYLYAVSGMGFTHQAKEFRFRTTALQSRTAFFYSNK